MENTKRLNLSVNTRHSFLGKLQRPSLYASAFSNFTILPQSNEVGLLPRHSLITKSLNPYDRISALERKMMKVLLNVIFI